MNATVTVRALDDGRVHLEAMTDDGRAWSGVWLDPLIALTLADELTIAAEKAGGDG